MKRCKDYIAIGKDPNDPGKESQKWWYRANYFAPLSSAQKYIDGKYLTKSELLSVLEPFSRAVLLSIENLSAVQDAAEEYRSILSECSCVIDSLFGISVNPPDAANGGEDPDPGSNTSVDVDYPWEFLAISAYGKKYGNSGKTFAELGIQACSEVSGCIDMLTEIESEGRDALSVGEALNLYKALDSCFQFAFKSNGTSAFFDGDDEDEGGVEPVGVANRYLMRGEGDLSCTLIDGTVIELKKGNCRFEVPNKALWLNPFITFENVRRIMNAFGDRLKGCCDAFDFSSVYQQLASRAFLLYVYEEFRANPILWNKVRNDPFWPVGGSTFGNTFGDIGADVPFDEWDPYADDCVVDVGKPSFDPLGRSLASAYLNGLVNSLPDDVRRKVFGTDVPEFNAADSEAIRRNLDSTFSKIIDLDGGAENAMKIYAAGLWFADPDSISPSERSVEQTIASILGRAANRMTTANALGSTLALMPAARGKELQGRTVQGLAVKEIKERLERFDNWLRSTLDDIVDGLPLESDYRSASITVKFKVSGLEDGETINDVLTITPIKELRAINEFTYQWQTLMCGKYWDYTVDGINCATGVDTKTFHVYTNSPEWGFVFHLASRNGYSGTVNVVAATAQDFSTGRTDNSVPVKMKSISVSVSPNQDKWVYLHSPVTCIGYREMKLPITGEVIKIATYQIGDSLSLFESDKAPENQYHGG